VDTAETENKKQKTKKENPASWGKLAGLLLGDNFTLRV
jgi:hypothetical protein